MWEIFQIFVKNMFKDNFDGYYINNKRIISFDCLAAQHKK